MGEIRDGLKVLATLIHEVDKCNQLDYIGEAIEAEIENLYRRFNNLNDNRIKDYNDLRLHLQKIESRIEALEKEVRSMNGNIEYLKKQTELNCEDIKALEKRHLRLDFQLDATREGLNSLKKKGESVPQEPLPCDKDGKPKGGLKPGDWLLGYGVGEPSLWIGEFKSIDKEQFVWANWRKTEKVKREGMGTAQFRIHKSCVIFLFRPKPEN